MSNRRSFHFDIHDFGGFPRELYARTYPASGDLALARRVQDMLAPVAVEWGLWFNEKVRHALQAEAYVPLIDYPAIGPEARLSVPTPDHYLPLLYVLGSRRKGENASFPIEGFDGGSMSMLTLLMSGAS
jgi:aromatic ring-opening dioxygenase catalytic subunit (LigB family)